MYACVLGVCSGMVEILGDQTGNQISLAVTENLVCQLNSLVCSTVDTHGVLQTDHPGCH